jgi:uncharacterized protein with NAD-binding domain and iron-sulfur cluster
MMHDILPDGKERKKVIILGGGMAALTTACELTRESDWKEHFESVTVYQMGWRLGGKGASGRGANGRIEEHGLHFWLGFYENAFNLIRTVYEEMALPADHPLPSFEQAFKPQNLIVIAEQVAGKWQTWPLDCPTNDSIPGDGGEFPTLWDYTNMLLEVIVHLFRSPTPAARPRNGYLGGLLNGIRHMVHAVEAGGLLAASQLLEAVQHRCQQLPPDVRAHKEEAHSEIVVHLDRFLAWIHREYTAEIIRDADSRRIFFLLDILVACLRGIFADGVLRHSEGLDSLNHYDLREWLQRHGAAEESYNSGAMRFLYDLAIAYENGDAACPSFAAGTALRCLGRVFFTYKGAIFWKMQAGMGDTVFGPLYKVLVKRGVKFQFFHRVKNLELSADAKSIATIHLGQQATLLPGRETYDPLFDCKGLECWPSAPLYEQLQEGEELRAQKINLESFWTPWKEQETPITLHAGTDFDVVVFGISIGSIPTICPELIQADRRWQAMCDRIQTTQTMGLQLWLKPNLQELGWKLAEQGPPVMDGYEQPLNTWADMSHLLDREDWPAEAMPQNIAYLCGIVKGELPSEDWLDAPMEAYEKGFDIAHQWLEANIRSIWPRAAMPDISLHPNGLDWDMLVDVAKGVQEERLKAQFWRINIDPSERYVLAVKGSSPYRIKPHESGYSNLVLVGDWTDCGLNVGCIEAAVMSGMLGANAIAGRPASAGIIGFPHLERGGI